MTHPQSSSLDSPNSSTFTLSIDISLGGTFAKSLSHHTHISEEVFWCLGSNSEMTNSFGWCNELIAGSGKLEKTRFNVTLLEQEAWRVFCYSCIPTLFSSGLLTAWRVVERFFAKYFNFFFDNISPCYLCVCISLPLLFTF